jgi:3-hydroxyacyl-CoA dehydrogenase
MTAKLDIRDGVALIAIDNPPVNALSANAGTVGALAAHLRACAADPAVAGIVIHGAGRFFSAGADIGEFRDDPARDVGPLRELLAIPDALGKPVVAAIHGLAFGGGLELALACHARVATPSAQFSFPEVALGLLPGGGGTQRAPRLIGTAAALDLALTGRKMSATEALIVGLIDRVADADTIDAAIALAVEIARSGALARRARDLTAANDADFANARETASAKRGLGEAPRLIVDCVEAAATKGFDEGLTFEYRAFDTLMLSEPARGLRHAFLAERKVATLPGLPRARKIADDATVAVIGAGTMGTGIAMALLDAGLQVILTDSKPDALARAGAAIDANFAAAIKKGRVTAEDANARRARLTLSGDLAATAPARLFIEAAFEDLAVKRDVFAKLDKIAAPDAILATNTSTLDVDKIADAIAEPERVIGLHFFSPANVMKLLEIVRGPRTRPQIVADALAFAKRIGKIGVVAGVCDGFIGNRIFEEYLRQAYFLLEEGALPAQIDRAMEKWGFAMGPLRVMDLAGQDIGWNIRKRRAIEQPARPYSRIPDLICEKGRLGQKTGAGFYVYRDGDRKGVADPEIDAMIEAHSASLGIVRRKIDDAEIVARCLFAMVNEGARILEEKIAARPLDIDVVYFDGYGFPRWRGGPMFHADRIGLPAVLARIEAFAAGYQGWAWTASPLLRDLAAMDSTFAALNKE